jgi:hypothetical protein
MQEYRTQNAKGVVAFFAPLFVGEEIGHVAV